MGMASSLLFSLEAEAIPMSSLETVACKEYLHLGRLGSEIFPLAYKTDIFRE